MNVLIIWIFPDIVKFLHFQSLSVFLTDLMTRSKVNVSLKLSLYEKKIPRILIGLFMDLILDRTGEVIIFCNQVYCFVNMR